MPSVAQKAQTLMILMKGNIFTFDSLCKNIEIMKTTEGWKSSRSMQYWRHKYCSIPSSTSDEQLCTKHTYYLTTTIVSFVPSRKEV